MRFMGCAHATTLDLAHMRGTGPKPREDSEDAAVLQKQGGAHEAAHLARLKDAGRTVIEIERSGLGNNAEATRAALTGGPDVMFQGAFLSGIWGGWSDFLERVDRPSALGPFSYEVADTKLKRRPHRKHVLQLVLYSDLLTEVQADPAPDWWTPHDRLSSQRKECPMEKKKRRYFPDEFKRQAAERVETSGLAVMDVAAELCVHETQLRRWIRGNQDAKLRPDLLIWLAAQEAQLLDPAVIEIKREASPSVARKVEDQLLQFMSVSRIKSGFLLTEREPPPSFRFKSLNLFRLSVDHTDVAVIPFFFPF